MTLSKTLVTLGTEPQKVREYLNLQTFMFIHTPTS